MDQRLVLAEFEVKGEKSCAEINETSEETVYDEDHESVEVYLAIPGVRGPNNSSWRRGMQKAELVSVPDRVEKLSGERFCECTSLFRVTFGEYSSLKLMGNMAFRKSGVCEIRIPDGLEELLCDADPCYTRISKT